MTAGPLAGIRIVDLTSVVLGPLATQILGDFGAEIIKVETLEGDLMRSNGVSLHAGMSNAAGREDLAQKYGAEDRQARNANIVAMYRDMAEMTLQRPTAEWMRICAELDIPATPIFALDELPEHPHLKAVGLFESAEHPSEGPIRYINPTTKFSATPATVRRQAPLLGQHTTEILREAGYDDTQITALKSRGVVLK